MRIEQMADKAISDLMKLREMGEGSGFSSRVVRRALP